MESKEGFSRLLTPREVAAIFRVTTQTVGRWADEGRLHPVTTPGGKHRRYRQDEVRALLDGGTE